MTTPTPQPPTPTPNLLTPKEVADRLRVSRATVYNLCECGKLASYRIGVGRGALRISEADLDAFIESCRDTSRSRQRPVVKKEPPIRLRHLGPGAGASKDHPDWF